MFHMRPDTAQNAAIPNTAEDTMRRGG